MGTRYRNFLKLCEAWPVDKSKEGRDLGAYIREQVARAFRHGETSKVDGIKCDKQYEALNLLVTSHYKKKYPTSENFCASGLSLEQLKTVMSTDSLQQLMEEDSDAKLQTKFGASSKPSIMQKTDEQITAKKN